MLWGKMPFIPAATLTFSTHPDGFGRYAQRIPKGKTMKREEFVDSSFVKKLDDERFYDRLFKR